MDINLAIKIMKEKVSNEYAQEYLKTLVDAIEQGGTKGLCVQLTYIIENAKGWRGEEAKEVKNFVKKWVESKQQELCLNEN